MLKQILRVLILILVAFTASGQRIKLFQLEQKGTPKEGYFGLTNADGNQRYVAHDSLVTTIITAQGHWYLNGADDAYGSTTISPGETVAFSGNNGITAGLAASGSNSLIINGSALQWNLGANGSYTTIGDAGSSESVNFVGAGIASTSRSGNTITITATETDGSTTNELDTWDLGANASYTTISNGEQVNFVGASGVTTSRTGNTITITGSSTLSGSGTTNYVTKWTSSTTLGNSAIQDNGATVSIGGALDASYELFVADGHIKVGDAAGELNKIYFGDGSFVYVGEHGADDRLYLRGSTLSVDIGGSLGSSGYVLTSNGTTATWAAPASGYSGWDLGANASYTTISSGEQVNFVGAGIASTSRSTNTITITATEVDGSTTNEIQGLDFFNASSPVTLYADGSGDGVMFVQGGIVTLSMSSDQLTISATEVDGSTTNELQTISVTGTTTGITTLSNSGGSMTIAAGGINSIGVSGSTITITATEVDGSTTNEIDEWDLGANASYTTISDGEQVNFVGASGVTTSRSGNTITITGSGSSATDLTFTGASSPYTLNSSTGTDVTFTSGGIVSLSRSSNELTISATEVDGSTTNELQTISVTGTTTGITTLSNSGGSMTIAAGGINSIGVSGSTITITATEVDGSTTNEINNLTFTGSVSGSIFFNNDLGTDVTLNLGSGLSLTSATASSATLTLTEGDGSPTNELDTWDLGANGSYTTISNAEQVNFVGASGVTTSRSGNTITITGSGSSATDLTFTGSGPFTLNSSTGSDVTFTEGANIDITRTSNDLSFAAIPSGSNTYVQYNSSGAFGAEAAFVYNATSNVLTSGDYIIGNYVGTGPSGGVLYLTSGAQIKSTHSPTPGWNYFSESRGFVGDFNIGGNHLTSTYNNQNIPVYAMMGSATPGYGYLHTASITAGLYSSINSSSDIGASVVYAVLGGSGITVGLPTSSKGRIIYMRNDGGSAATIDPASSGTINSSTTLSMDVGAWGILVETTGTGVWVYYGN